MRTSITWKTVLTAFTVAAAVYAYRTRQSHGTFLGVPFEFKIPTTARIRERWWNPDDPRLFTPSVLGVGWSLNLYRLVEGLRGAPDPEHDSEPGK